MNFDEIIERRGTHSDKWDMMQTKYGRTGSRCGWPTWISVRPPA
jgi:cystathionine beta-lyase